MHPVWRQTKAKRWMSFAGLITHAPHKSQPARLWGGQRRPEQAAAPAPQQRPLVLLDSSANRLDCICRLCRTSWALASPYSQACICICYLCVRVRMCVCMFVYVCVVTDRTGTHQAQLKLKNSSNPILSKVKIFLRKLYRCFLFFSNTIRCMLHIIYMIFIYFVYKTFYRKLNLLWITIWNLFYYNIAI